MTGYLANIEKTTIANTDFRRVLYTGQHLQLVVMSILPGEDIGTEVHEIVDQFLRVEEGEGLLILGEEEKSIRSGDAFIIPAGSKHNVKNTSSEASLKLYTLYAPPHHKDGVRHETKAAADSDTEDHI